MSFGYRMFSNKIIRSHEKYTAEQFRANVLKLSNINTLQKIVISDDHVFRSTEDLERLTRVGFVYICSIAVLTSFLNIVFLFIEVPLHKRIFNVVLVIAFFAYLALEIMFINATN